MLFSTAKMARSCGIPDFIFTHTQSKFELDGHQIDMSCNKAEQHALLTKACFNIMLSDDSGLHFNIGEISSSFILDAEDKELTTRINTNISAVLKYASGYWASHLAQTGQLTDSNDLIDHISNFLHIHILFWIEAMHLLGSSGQCNIMLQHAREWVLKVKEFIALHVLHISNASWSECNQSIRACC